MHNKKISLFMLVIILLFIFIPNGPIFAVTASSIKVQQFNGNKTANSNSIDSNYKIVNTSTSAINLSDIKLKYYYTSDGAQTDKFWCDHSGMMSGYSYLDLTSKVTGKFVKFSTPTDNADSYVEIGFASNAGQLKPGDSITIQTRVTKDNWSNYNQSNDYSFNPTAGDYVDTKYVTGYIGGVLVNGNTNSVSAIDEKPVGGSQIVKDSTINPTSITYGRAIDTPITMTLNGNKLISIYNGTTQVASQNYTVANNVVTIMASYLATLPLATNYLTFKFSSGKDANLSLIRNTVDCRFSMDLGKVTGKAGDTLTVPLDFNNVPSYGILGTNFSISYDSTLLELIDVTPGTIVTNPSINFTYTNLPDQKKVIITFCDETYSSELISTSGNFMNLNFKIRVTKAVVSPLIIEDCLVADIDVNSLYPVIRNGSIIINEDVVPPVV